jgi:hypothetical protein
MDGNNEVNLEVNTKKTKHLYIDVSSLDCRVNS